VVAHASYLLSFKPLHTISIPPAAPKASSGGRYKPTTPSTRFNSGLALLPPVLEPRPRPSTLDPSDSLPHTLTNRTTPALHISLTPPRPQTADHALSPSNHSTATRFPTQNIPPPVLSSLLPTNQVLAPHSNLDSPPSTQPRETATLLPPWSTGRSCIAPGNVALWCEEFRLPIGMPGPVLQNLVISKPKVSLPILNDNHDHQPTLT
jgi:hypothetical protein